MEHILQVQNTSLSISTKKCNNLGTDVPYCNFFLTFLYVLANIFFYLQHFSVNHDSVASVIKHLALVYRKQVGICCQLGNDMNIKDAILTVCIGIVSRLKKGEGLNHQKSFYVQIVNAYIMSIFSKKNSGTPPLPLLLLALMVPFIAIGIHVSIWTYIVIFCLLLTPCSKDTILWKQKPQFMSKFSG